MVQNGVQVDIHERLNNVVSELTSIGAPHVDEIRETKLPGVFLVFFAHSISDYQARIMREKGFSWLEGTDNPLSVMIKRSPSNS